MCSGITFRRYKIVYSEEEGHPSALQARPLLGGTPAVSVCVRPEVICTWASLQEYGFHVPAQRIIVLLFYFEILINLHAMVRTNTERFKP